ncbi:hypothetical protein Tco_0571588 [Tanacetum coccineum]
MWVYDVVGWSGVWIRVTNGDDAVTRDAGKARGKSFPAGAGEEDGGLAEIFTTGPGDSESSPPFLPKVSMKSSGLVLAASSAFRIEEQFS